MGELPPRRQFNPTAEEIIREYLTRKNNEEAFHSNMIHTIQFYDFGPDFLSGIHGPSGDRVWYYFTKRKRSNRPNVEVDRTAGEGYWKVAGAVKHITHDGRRIGVRRPFAYFRGTYQNSVRTDWLMKEFTAPEVSVRYDDWVVCKMYESTSKKGNSSSIRDVVNEAGSSRKRNHDGEEKDGKAKSTQYKRRRAISSTATATASSR